MQRDQALQVIGQLGTMLRLAVREGVALQIVRVAQVVHTGHVRAEQLAVRAHAAHGGAGEVHTVVAALTADQARALGLATDAVVADGDLQRRFHRF